MNAKEAIREQIDLDWTMILGELVSDCKKNWGITQWVAMQMAVWSDRVVFQLDFLLQHSWMQFCLKRQNPTVKQNSIIFSSCLLNFLQLAWLLNLAQVWLIKRFLGISVSILCSAPVICYHNSWEYLKSSQEWARGRQSFPITLFPSLQRRPEHNLVVTKLRDHICSPPPRLMERSHAFFGSESRDLSAQREVSSVVYPTTDLAFLTFIATADVLVMLLFWGQEPLWAPGLSSSCSCGKRIHIIIMESSFCHFSLHHLGTSSQGSISQSALGFLWTTLPNHHPSVSIAHCLCSHSHSLHPNWSDFRPRKLGVAFLLTTLHFLSSYLLHVLTVTFGNTESSIHLIVVYPCKSLAMCCW